MQKKYISLYCLMILLVGLLSYFNSFYNGFVWDDEVLIEKNQLIRNFGSYKKVLTQELLAESKTNYYRPLQVFSYAVDYRIWKLNPFGYHLTNFLLHIFNAILIYILVSQLASWPVNKIELANRRGTRESGSGKPANFIALLTALFWVVHPVHVEAVTYISGRADLLAAFFILSAFILYIKSRAESLETSFFTIHHSPFTIHYLFSVLCFELALFSKEASLAFPFILIIYEYVFRRREKLSSRLRRPMPFIAIALFYIFLRLTILSFGPGIWQKAIFSAGGNIVRMFSFLKGSVVYLRLLIIPGKLYMERYIPPAAKVYDPYVVTAFLIIGALFIIYKRLNSENRRFAAFAVLWFIIFIFPQSAVFFPTLVSDHFLYIPSIGVFFVSACGLSAVYARRKYFALTVTIAIIFFWGLSTFAQGYVWRNNVTFYQWADKYNPTSFKTLNNLANIYFELGQEDLAIAKYEEALAISPKNTVIKENMDYVSDEYIERYKNKIKLGFNFAAYYYNLAYLYGKKGRLDEAVDCYKKAIEINPKFSEALSNLGNVYERQGKFPEALTQYKQAVSVNPNFAQGYFNIGVVLGNQGKLKEAEDYFEKALSLKPDYENARVYIEQIKKMLLENPGKEKNKKRSTSHDVLSTK